MAEIETTPTSLIVHPVKAIAIRLCDERYARLIIGVDDPAVIAKAINTAAERL